MADNLLTRKLGPLPTWGWLGIVTGLGLVYYEYEKKKAGTATTAATTATSTAASNVPDYVFQNYNQIPATTPAPAPATTGTPAPATTPTPSPATTVQYLKGGNPTGVGGAASQTTTGNVYNFSSAQIQQMGFPNLKGMTLAQAQAALASYAGGAYKIANANGNQSGKVVSFTPYSNGQVNLGLA